MKHKKGTIYRVNTNNNNSKPERTPSFILQKKQQPPVSYWTALTVHQENTLHVQKPQENESLRESLKDLKTFQLRDLDYLFYHLIHAVKDDKEAIATIAEQFKFIAEKYKEIYSKLLTVTEPITETGLDSPITVIPRLLAQVRLPFIMEFPGKPIPTQLNETLSYHSKVLTAWAKNYNEDLKQVAEMDPYASVDEDVYHFYFLTRPYYCTLPEIYAIDSSNDYLINQSADSLINLMNTIKSQAATLQKLPNPFSDLDNEENSFSHLSNANDTLQSTSPDNTNLAETSNPAGKDKKVPDAPVIPEPAANVDPSSNHSNRHRSALKLIGILFLAALASPAYGVKKFCNSVKNIIDGKKYTKSFIRIAAILSGAAGGAVGGMIAGAIIGSAVPIIGTGLGAIIGFGVGGAASGIGLGALIGKHLGKFISWVLYDDTNPDKYQPDPSVINESDQHSISQILGIIRPMKNELGCVSSIPLTDERDTKNGYNKLIKEVQKSKIGNTNVADITQNNYNTIVSDYIEKYKADPEQSYTVPVNMLRPS